MLMGGKGRILILTTAAAALLCRAAAALETKVRGEDRDRVEIVRVKPPVDISLKKVLPLPIPSADEEFRQRDTDMMWHSIRNLRLHSLDMENISETRDEMNVPVQ
jgi:hypothetical protein